MKKYIVAIIAALTLLTSVSSVAEEKKDIPNIKVYWVLDFMTYKIPKEKDILGFFVRGMASGQIKPSVLESDLTNEEIFEFCIQKEKEGMTFFQVFMLKDDRKKRKAILASKEKHEVAYGREVDIYMANSVLDKEAKKRVADAK